MDRSERLAEQYLKTCGFGEIVYEPDGNVSPDFLCDGRVAIEVRRLNQAFTNGGTMRGLEEVAIPLVQRIVSLLEEFGPADEPGWYVTLRFKRPVPKWVKLRPKLLLSLKAIKSSNGRTRQVIRIHDNLEIVFDPAGVIHAHAFELGGFDDLDKGGWAMPELTENLNRCIQEKVEKHLKRLSRYSEWWLIFVDYITYGVTPRDAIAIRNGVTAKHVFDKVVLLNPCDPTRAFVL